MNSTFYLKKKFKIAAFLFCIMACSILIRFLEDRSVKDMEHSFRSMFNDRLVPSVLLHDMNVLVTSKFDLLEEGIRTSPAPADLRASLSVHNARIDSLLRVYEKTYLVRQEANHLADLRTGIMKNRQHEETVINLVGSGHVAAAKQLNESEGQRAVLSTVQTISELISLQVKVAEELLQDVDFMVSGSKFYSAIQLGLAILIGLLIMSILFTVRSVSTKQDNFHLN